MDVCEAPDWKTVVFDWPGGEGCNDARPAFVAWVASLGLDPNCLKDRAAVVAASDGRYYLHIDQVYRVAGFEFGKTAGPDAGDPLDWDHVLTKRHIIEVPRDSWPVG